MERDQIISGMSLSRDPFHPIELTRFDSATLEYIFDKRKSNKNQSLLSLQKHLPPVQRKHCRYILFDQQICQLILFPSRDVRRNFVKRTFEGPPNALLSSGRPELC